MKSIFKIAVFSWFFMLMSLAQAQKLRISEAEKLSNDITHFDVLGKVDGNILLYKYGRDYFEVNAFNSTNLDLAWSKQIRFKSKRPNMIEMILTNNGALAFYNVKQNATNTLMVQAFDKDFQAKGEPLLVNETSEKGVIYRVNHSANRQFFAIEIIDKSGINNQNIDFMVLNESLQKTANISIVNSNNWAYKNSLLGLNGELFLVSNEKQSGWITEANTSQSIKINALINGVLMEKIIDKKGISFDSYTTKLDLVNNQVLVAGVFSQNNNTQPDGYFYYGINFPENGAWNNNETSVFAPFPSDLQAKTNRKSLLGQKNRLDELTIREIVPRSDGGVLVCGELYNEAVTNNNPVGNIHTDLFANRAMQTQSFNYDDMVVLSLSKDGSLEWAEVLRKSQYSEDDDGHFSSFGIINLKDKVQLMFNEKIDYITPVNSFSLSDNGASGIKTLFNSQKYDILMSPRHAKQVAKNEVIIPAYTTRNYFVLVQLVY